VALPWKPQAGASKGKETMLEILFNGIDYKIVPIGMDHDGWMTIDSAGSLEEAHAKCKRDWDFFWNLCGLVPSRRTSVILV
jgi:hypothetical protein